MKKTKKSRGIESLRSRYGYTFVGHWIFGILMFFIFPVINSFKYAFSNISILESGFDPEFVGLANIKEILFENPDYVTNMRDAIGSMFYSLPMVVAISLILAVLLNQRFPGRTILRIIFFLPVILSSSVVVNLLSDPNLGQQVFNLTTDGEGIMNYQEILGNLELPKQINDVLIFFLSNAVNLTWNCGVQTILFLAGLQSIPSSLYEVSKIEGANKWEEFWMITIPMLRHVISLVIIYTMISLFTASNNAIMTAAISLMTATDYGVASAMLWFYFVIVLAVIGLILLAYNKMCLKKWE